MVVKLMHPKLRFVGWEPIGAFRRAVDERTVEELRESIQLWAKRVPEVGQVLPELDHMNPKHFNLIADTIELSQKPANMFQDVDMLEKFEIPPFNTLDLLMAHIPIASRKAPDALDFAQEVINKTGKITSKFFLRDAAEVELLPNPKHNENFKNAIPLVEDFAKLAESHKMRENSPFSRQEDFMDQVLAILDENVMVEKIPLLKEVFDRIRGNGAFKLFDMDKFLADSTPVEVIKANLDTLKSANSYAYSFGKYLDVNAQLSKDPKDVEKVCTLDSIPSYMR